MGQIVLTPQAVNAYKELITNPTANGLDFPPLSECFEECDEATAKHILYDKYVEFIQKPLPKVFFYIIMDEIYFKQIAKAADGNLGYKLKLRKHE